MPIPRTQHVRPDVVQRSAGGHAVKAAAYCKADSMTCDGRTFDFTRKRGEHAGHAMLVPSGAPDWAADAESLWQHAERFEKKSSSQTARLLEIELPRAVPAKDRLALLCHIAEPFRAAGMAVQCDVHNPLASGGGEQPHGHLVMTMREFDSGGDFAKKKVTGLEWNKWFQRNGSRDVHKLISDRTNQWMAAHGIDCRVTHMSNAEKGADERPERDVPKRSWETWKAQPDHPAAAPVRETLAARAARRQYHRARAAERQAVEEIRTLGCHIEANRPGVVGPRRKGASWTWDEAWTPQVKRPVTDFVLEDARRRAVLILEDGSRVIDRGNRLTIAGRVSDQSIAAIAEAARRHGWQRVAVTGDLVTRDRIAAALAARGVMVVNCQPTPHALKAAERQVAADRRAAAPPQVAGNPAPPAAPAPKPRPRPTEPEPVPTQVAAPQPSWAVPPWARSPGSRRDTDRKSGN